ncbi:LPS export ABC transporter permease LptG [Sneathiella limimaris]|uniref:LPS export ABC transporter permease LptG n=1 Tax=Sneathiella limimaris TaxID=1964213 RepID=UPI00146BEE0D|nr:LPS export ABC transporter permease LptG [Sneathiella limimaris]
MKLSSTLSIYLGKQFLKNVAIIFSIIISIVFIADFIEFLRQTSDKEDLSIFVPFQLALLRLPTLAQILFPFIALFGGMLTFFRLSRTNELTVIRSAGVSAWLFLMPSLAIAFFLGVFMLTVINPIAAAMQSYSAQLETKYFEQRSNLLVLTSNNLWLRQVDDNGLFVIHARGAINQGIELTDVIIFQYDRNENFTGRIEADTARLMEGYWDLKRVLMTSPEQPGTVLENLQLSTSLTAAQIQESFAPPKEISFWELPEFISTLEEAGFSALNHRIYWHSLIARPVLLLAMVLVAATFSLRATRRGKTGILVMAGITTGFVFYFFTDIILALGLAGNLPVLLAAWTPSIAITLLGLSMMFHLEDG